MIKSRLSNLKMAVYCAVVNQNVYVRDEYHLPIEIDSEYHKRHRLYDWGRLLKLLIKYRVLNKKPSEQKIAELEEMRKKRDLLFSAIQNINEPQKVEDETEKTRVIFEEAIKAIKSADFMFDVEYKNIICLNNSTDDGRISYILSCMQKSCREQKYLYRFIQLKNTIQNIEVLPTFLFPVDLHDENIYDKKINLTLELEEEQTIEYITRLHNAYDWIINHFPNADAKYVKVLIYQMYTYFSAVVEYFKPQIFLMSENIWFCNEIVRQIAEEYHVQCLYLEQGEIPNTFSIDMYGFDEESYRGRYHKWKKRLPALNQNKYISREEIERLWYRDNSYLKRYFDFEIEKLDWNQPTVLFCGQDDFGNIPILGDEMVDASLFKITDEVLWHIKNICKKQSWNLVYLLHDNTFNLLKTKIENFSNDVICGNNCNRKEIIKLADVVITRDTKSAYEALAYEKPVVLLGNSKLKGQECCYEAENVDDIEDMLNKAILESVTFEQSRNYVEEIEYLRKYFLFSLGKNDSRTVNNAVDVFNKLLEGNDTKCCK